MKFNFIKATKRMIIVLIIFVVSFIGVLLTENKTLNLVSEDGFKYQTDNGDWQYVITTTFNGEEIQEAHIVVDFYKDNQEKIYEYNQTLLEVEGNVITSYYTMKDEANTYKIVECDVGSRPSILYYLFSTVSFVSMFVLLITLRKVRKERKYRHSVEKEVSNNIVRKVRVLDESKMSKKEAPNLEDLIKKSDEQIKLIKEGRKNELNGIEARYLGYGLDLINWSKEKLNLEFTLKENDIKKLDDIIKFYRESNAKQAIDDDFKDFLVWGIAGVFGIIATHYKNCEWVNENDREHGHKLLTKYDINENGEQKKAMVTTFVEAKAARLIHHLMEDETMISLYYSLPYGDGSIPFKEYTFEEYQEILKQKENK